ncbi:Intradiol ring-cleavage dioxygenase [Pseudomassariella vexata]|uniref:Intradiol ring-cleavage dioxygenase n=1 Tax=Pseudomassariella vexata TaxID=1141098 RepID=A0A1Y2DUV2_9PEZI|nr:Intradiol ring-cleavage dioxygenase [Pseudomassariella vexata]ORY63060.1 Intradiol ring-cleavage dioxygenase [Pseudomassariella vexata]
MPSFRSVVTSVVVFASLYAETQAHPGEHHDAEKIKRDLRNSELAARNANQILAQCQGTAQGKALKERAIMRRAIKAQELREKRGLEESRMLSKRDQEDLDAWMRTCHDMSDRESYDLSTPMDTIFGSNATAGLAPETIIGPYWVEGEFIRTNVTEGQQGIPIHVDLQFVDISSCAAVPSMLVDLWHANATGTYSGVVDGGGLNSTFMRGIQITDTDGVVQFDSVFPGHYMGRTNHIHVISNRGGTLFDNGTYTGGTVNHIGQLYFDQELIDVIESMPPYYNNPIRQMVNVQDFLVAQEASREHDPFVDYVLLSEDPADGVLMWITIGIDAAADHNGNVTAAAHYYKEGGVSNGRPPGNFSMPPFPTGTRPPGFPPGPPSPTSTSRFWGPCMKRPPTGSG